MDLKKSADMNQDSSEIDELKFNKKKYNKVNKFNEESKFYVDNDDKNFNKKILKIIWFIKNHKKGIFISIILLLILLYYMSPTEKSLSIIISMNKYNSERIYEKLNEIKKNKFFNVLVIVDNDDNFVFENDKISSNDNIEIIYKKHKKNGEYLKFVNKVISNLNSDFFIIMNNDPYYINYNNMRKIMKSINENNNLTLYTDKKINNLPSSIKSINELISNKDLLDYMKYNIYNDNFDLQMLFKNIIIKKSFFISTLKKHLNNFNFDDNYSGKLLNYILINETILNYIYSKYDLHNIDKKANYNNLYYSIISNDDNNIDECIKYIDILMKSNIDLRYIVNEFINYCLDYNKSESINKFSESINKTFTYLLSKSENDLNLKMKLKGEYINFIEQREYSKYFQKLNLYKIYNSKEIESRFNKNRDYVVFCKQGKFINYENIENINKNFDFNKQPKISIFFPTYNKQYYLLGLIRSIQNQSLKEIEIIFIDDFSSDKSSNIIKEFMKHDKRIRLVSLPQNRGLLYARGQGIYNSRGKYIQQLDADDLMSNPNILEKAYNVGISYDIDIVQFQFIYGEMNVYQIELSKYLKPDYIEDHENNDYNTNILNNDNQEKAKKNGIKIYGRYEMLRNLFYPILKDSFVLNNHYSWDKLMKREVALEMYGELQNFINSVRINFFEDTLTNVVLFLKAKSFVFIEEIGTFYSQNYDSLIHTNKNSNNFYICMFTVCNKMYEYIKLGSINPNAIVYFIDMFGWAFKDTEIQKIKNDTIIKNEFNKYFSIVMNDPFIIRHNKEKILNMHYKFNEV